MDNVIIGVILGIMFVASLAAYAILITWLTGGED